MRTLDSLLEEAKSGTLTDEEISYVVSRIKECKESNETEDLYTLIYTLGMADCIDTPTNIYAVPRGIKYRDLIESLLYELKDTEISRIVLKTLCTYWGLTEEYVDDLKKFIKGIDWDEEGMVAILAISIAGEYLRKSDKKDKELLKLLINLWETLDESESEIDLETVYTALARSVGEEWNDIFSNPAPDPSVIEKVYKMNKS